MLAAPRLASQTPAAPETPDLAATAGQQAWNPRFLKAQAHDLAISIYHVAQLAALHDEATETTLLASLWGRASHAAAFLTLTAAVIAATADSGPGLAIWLVALGAGLAIGTFVYGRVLLAPFAREVLQRFVRDFAPAMSIAGLAWGTGAFLLPSVTSGPWTLLAFVLGPQAALACILRTQAPLLAFVLPTAAMGAIAAALPAFGSEPGTAGVILLGGATIMALTYGAERLAIFPRAFANPLPL
ncbi:MAG TPA: hypothetical protein VGF97_08145 [Rhizomicrobium sp.]|jgi:hypothetical protein